MKKFIPVVLTVLLLVGSYACTHKSYTEGLTTPKKDSTTTTNNNNNNNNNDTSTVSVDTSVCFERDILPIFLGSCGMNGCHSAASHEKGYVLISYSTIMSAGVIPGHSASSAVYTYCVSGKMPESPIAKLDSTQLSMLARWINNGAHDDTNCVVTCDTTHYTYASAIAPILKSNCYSCHASASASGSGGGIVLDNYNSLLIQAQNGKLIGDLEHTTGFNAMPLGGNQLPSCQITQISKWIAAGAQNN